MSAIVDAIRQHAERQPDRLALTGAGQRYNYAELYHHITQLATELRETGIPVMGLHADNSPDWLVVDLACQAADITLVPLPGFFSSEQLGHVLSTSGMGAVLCDQPEPFSTAAHHRITTLGLYLNPLKPCTSVALPTGTAKITFTSGSTGRPKGVCLSQKTMDNTARALVQALAGIDMQRHLCALPLPTLLENVAGAYSTLLRGDILILPSLHQLGFNGSASLDIATFATTLRESASNSVILLPQLLKALLLHSETTEWRPPASLNFVAVGGARVAADLIKAARQAGLPAFEGYGLSECGSVVALNRPGADRPGTVGAVLPHCRVAIQDGEICVSGSGFLGYLEQPAPEQGLVQTGDLGTVQNGVIEITGRRKNLLISTFGRNIAPEWPESELLAATAIQQCVVVGDDRPYCSALLWPQPGTTAEALEHCIEKANARLPDYARIQQWAVLPRPLNAVDGELTSNGRPRRDVISSRYQSLIDSLYPPESQAQPSPRKPFQPNNARTKPEYRL